MTILRDGFTRALLVAALVLWLPYFLPGSPLGAASGTAFALQGVMLALGIAGCLSEWSRRSRAERRFFGLVALGLGAWGAEQLIEFQIESDWASDLRLSLLGDSLYLVLYLCMILAVELRPPVPVDDLIS